MTGKEDNMERKMEKLDQIVARMEEDKKLRRRQQMEDSERLFLKREWEKEKKRKRIEKARQLEDNWKMLKWATTYIEDNEEDWLEDKNLQKENTGSTITTPSQKIEPHEEKNGRLHGTQQEDNPTEDRSTTKKLEDDYQMEGRQPVMEQTTLFAMTVPEENARSFVVFDKKVEGNC